MERLDCVVIGAGAVGLAIARAFALAGREVVVLEAESAIGTGISARNSEVIHAGIYYPRDSLKARLCVAGKAALYAYCASHGVGHARCGKLIVATRAEHVGVLQSIRQKAAANGVDDLRLLSAADVRALEPDLQCVGALMSPSTGIVDSHGFMLALQGDAEQAGAVFAFNTPVLGGRIDAAGVDLDVGGSEPGRWRAATVINCAGLHAPKLAAGLEGFPAGHVPAFWFAKGSYFSLAGRTPFSHLVYPVPEEHGLGVHLTLDLNGRARFGPDVERVRDIDYRVDGRRADAFYAEIRKYWPALPDDALLPDYAGVRPKIGAPASVSDFRIDGPGVHGVPGLVNLFGIESPGLTSSLAIAEHVLTVA